jgi:hypothetical protein
VKLVQAALRRRLEEVLKGLTLRTEHCQPFTLQDLFPEEEREKDFDVSGRPQVSRGAGRTSCLFLLSKPPQAFRFPLPRN